MPCTMEEIVFKNILCPKNRYDPMFYSQNKIYSVSLTTSNLKKWNLWPKSLLKIKSEVICTGKRPQNEEF